jgi:hypothetical protein
MRLAVLASAAAAIGALVERVVCAACATTAAQPVWLGARAESWADDQFIPRLAEQLIDVDGRLVVVEVHTTGVYHGSSQDADVVAVLQKRGKQLCVEYFHPTCGPDGTGPDEQKRASNA